MSLATDKTFSFLHSPLLCSVGLIDEVCTCKSVIDEINGLCTVQLKSGLKLVELVRLDMVLKVHQRDVVNYWCKRLFRWRMGRRISDKTWFWHRVLETTDCRLSVVLLEQAQLLLLLYEPRHDRTNKMSVRPAKTQISLGIRLVWSESSLSAWRKLLSLATHWVHSEDSDQSRWMPRLIRVFAGRTVTLLVLSWGGSYIHSRGDSVINGNSACRSRSDDPWNFNNMSLTLLLFRLSPTSECCRRWTCLR